MDQFESHGWHVATGNKKAVPLEALGIRVQRCQIRHSELDTLTVRHLANIPAEQQKRLTFDTIEALVSLVLHPMVPHGWATFLT